MPTQPALSKAAPRLAVIDWGLAEAALALGVVPVAAAELDGYARWVKAPAMPPGVIDLGLRGEPNLEALHRAAPDLILTTPQFAPFLPRLERIAPVASFATYQPGGNPLERSFDIVMDLGRRLGRPDRAAALRAEAAAVFAAAAVRLDRVRPLLVAGFVDQRHLRVYGGNSLFGATLARLGLVNGWTAPTSAWGFATVGVEHLAVSPEAQLLLLDPMPPDLRASLPRNPIWQALPAVRAGRVTLLPPCWAFGGLPSAMRFADLLAAGLADG
ncbi:ABC transporter substrate-binding protein [Falsiroseomonas sp. HC035]|uniref:ABC transporter substrate-binding protein n=1 Tax=Falsiroseomonas sp. HC035 TaxID=3390999 RepID=UPI003D31672E